MDHNELMPAHDGQAYIAGVSLRTCAIRFGMVSVACHQQWMTKNFVLVCTGL